MDLDDFDSAIGDRPPPPSLALYTAQDAVDYIDMEWYAATNRRGRWMDLIGDYAGQELFVIDGDALIQHVLDDSLLGIGRPDDTSFQLPHALHSLERMLEEFLNRSAVFEIVFFQENRHLTLHTGSSGYVFVSRSLARTLLVRHLKQLDIPVHVFTNLDDPLWTQYMKFTKPMFVMTNDGGVLDQECNTFSLPECILTQRIFIYILLSQGTPVSLLQGAEFRDSKVMSFVYEQRLDRGARKRLDGKLWAASSAALESLEAQEVHARHGVPVASLTTFSPQSLQPLPRHDHQVLTNLVRAVSSSTTSSSLEFRYELLFAFVAHLLVVPTLSIEQRARPLMSLHPKLKNLLLDSFLPSVFLALEDISSQVSIDVDGHIFAALLAFLSTNTTAPLDTLLGPQVYSTLHHIWTVSLKLPPVDYRRFCAQFPPVGVKQDIVVAKPRPSGLLPFSHPVFDNELKSIRVNVEGAVEEASVTHLEFDTVFNDTQHWHDNNKAILPGRMGGEDAKPMDEWQRRRALRREQRFMSSMQWQASTLTGALGATLQQMVIQSASVRKGDVGSRIANTLSEKQSQKTQNANKKPKAVHISSADKIRLANAAKKQSTKDDSNRAWWQEQLNSMANMSTELKITTTENLLRNSRTEEGWFAVEIHLYRLHLKFQQWIYHPDRESAGVRDHFTVPIMRIVKDVHERKGLFPTAVKIIGNVLTVLGFADYIPSLTPVEADLAADRSLSFDFVKLVKSKSKSSLFKFMRIVEDPIVWQLRLFGEFMDRSMDSRPDSRVSFQPDAWQRRVLDCLDANQSVLVIAPTSAGKTFISYYAMEQVLRTSDNGILVYVAPTKALVNQIAAEVYARFKKEVNGGSCWAIHTRDYRIHNPQNCQILVTVPEVLATLLLSPPLTRTWTPRIRRIILDEIHSIGQQEGGAVWEQIILLAPCPIIGLSATIGHPERFNDWLQSVQEAHGYNHTFIQHPHRYSHLRKFTYLVQEKSQTFTGLSNYSSTNRLKFLHPVSMLSFGARNSDLPSDFSLEAADCLTLYQAYHKCRGRIPFEPGALDPSQFFSGSAPALLKQKDILRYEVELKTGLSKLISSSDPQDASSALNDVIGCLVDPALQSVDNQYIPSRTAFYDNLIHLVSDLHSSGDLPAIFFQFDRKACEIMGQLLLDNLEAAEDDWRARSPEWARKIQQWETWKLQAYARERQAERLKKQKKGTEEHEVDHEVMASWESSFDPADPSPQFSFAGISKFEKTTLDEEIESLSRWTSVKPWFFKALRRGIGIHHSGMNKQYRTLVESLFRLGFLRVVIATGTLALGINAPTKTSVFCGDSPFLTALMYRQCAGRAGRRGYDLLGKVVFYGIAMDRCQRLVLSRLPSLGGNFPLTSTMVLRLFNLLQGSKKEPTSGKAIVGSPYAPVAENAIRSLLKLPHVSFVSEAEEQQILHHIRFSIDYLRRAGLLDHEGNPINLFGIAAHLYYTEPSNLALVALMHRGVIHRICSHPDLITAKKDFLILLCHLFGRRYLSKSYVTEKNLKILIRKSPSMVILPPLPADAREVLLEHDKEILQVFTSYALTYASQYSKELGADSQLPLSQRAYPLSHDNPSSPFRDYLDRTAVKVSARSLFVANSGHSDSFQTVKELTGTIRRGLHLNEHAIPTMHRLTTIPGSGDDFYALNAYLLDFYIHGQPAALTAANGIRPGDLWYVLQDFDLSLKAIRAGLGQLLLKASKAKEDAVSASGDIDSGYGSFDPAEVDVDEGGPDSGSLKRPVGVSDRDWKVYEVIDTVSREFEEKFRAMWA
ncbi:Uncharacterized helicase [Sparassis crispa]|uniref:Uncharacterized helicase n=1 Tax=Sparassis crispa TaxID=139825 RepID=A0A401GNS2_9APHY|nr:Uncharacterized helicase [Sparassis crispa]GBE83891.1 Uncharacterized helicase [Sparassis crispa]